jgi:hypothetical protein
MKRGMYNIKYFFIYFLWFHCKYLVSKQILGINKIYVYSKTVHD